jgi:hypothetical protein
MSARPEGIAIAYLALYLRSWFFCGVDPDARPRPTHAALQAFSPYLTDSR